MALYRLTTRLEETVQHSFEVGFKDVYPWVWSVMLGVALMLAERRGAFLSVGTKAKREFWTKNILAVVINVVLPAVLFGLTLVRLGPMYSPNMDFWQILGALYLAGVPLGSHHVWQVVATYRGWMPTESLRGQEQQTLRIVSHGNMIWAVLAFGIPALATVVGWRLPF